MLCMTSALEAETQVTVVGPSAVAWKDGLQSAAVSPQVL